jgi:hypothetical protein
VNQDENIDQYDSPILLGDVDNGNVYGYKATDLNGDGNVDQFDSPLMINNINAGVFSQHP